MHFLMPFDESQTVETPNGQYVNQMKSGRAMLPRFQGEKSIYPTAEEADQAAGLRSTYEYDELRRDPNNSWYTPGTPAPPLLDVPGQSMHQAPPIGKKQSMQDPNSIIDTIQGGLKSMQFESLMKGTFDPKAQAQKAMATGGGTEANERQASWKPKEPTSLVATDATQGIQNMVGSHGAATSGLVMGAAGTNYDKKAAPIVVAGMPMGIGGNGNNAANSQLKTLEEEQAAALQGLNRGAPVQPGQVGTPGDPLWTAEQKRQRLGGPKPKAQPVDPYAGMDPDLRKAMEQEDKRNKGVYRN